MYIVNDKWQATERWSFRAARLSQGLHWSLLWGNEDGVAKIGGLSLELLHDSRLEWFPEGSRVRPVGRWPWPTSKAPAGVHGFARKSKTKYTGDARKRQEEAVPGCLRIINLSLAKQDRIPTSGAGERNWCYVAETERKYLDNAGTTRLGQISLDPSQIFTP